jgi:hypothetical protein
VGRFGRAAGLVLSGAVIGTGFGIALGFFLFPFVFPPPPASETLLESDRATLIANGTFIHANPSDPIHWGRGTVSVYRQAVFLESDFEVGPGPAYHVYLVPKANIRADRDFTGVNYIDLGRLRSFKGSQRYQMPEGVSPADYASVIVWCERFRVLITPADLKSAK